MLRLSMVDRTVRVCHYPSATLELCRYLLLIELKIKQRRGAGFKT